MVSTPGNASSKGERPVSRRSPADCARACPKCFSAWDRRLPIEVTSGLRLAMIERLLRASGSADIRVSVALTPAFGPLAWLVPSQALSSSTPQPIPGRAGRSDWSLVNRRRSAPAIGSGAGLLIWDICHESRLALRSRLPLPAVQPVPPDSDWPSARQPSSP
jgi:hypothetical protein